MQNPVHTLIKQLYYIGIAIAATTVLSQQKNTRKPSLSEKKHRNLFLFN